MDDAKELWSQWQSLLSSFSGCFTLGGWARFTQWVTGTVFCSEEHTITQILASLELESQWRNVEHFAEYGSWNRPSIGAAAAATGRAGGSGVDDTKGHRTSADVWGTCTFHESGARCQLPVGEPFRTKTDWAVDVLRWSPKACRSRAPRRHRPTRFARIR